MDLYLFDLDKTLYAYNFRKRLPALSRATGVSQYQLARSWWAPGFEARAERGEWPTPDEYLSQFSKVTGATLTLDEWTDARRQAMSRIDGSVDALRRCATLGTAALFSNNPSPLGAALHVLAPDVAEIVGQNTVFSFQIGARKPAPESFTRALEHFHARSEDTFFADDSAQNVASARTLGIQAHRFTTVGLLDAAINRFAGRER